MTDAVPSALQGLLHLGRQAYVALEDSGTVHLTPVLYAWADGRFWFAAAAGTRKVRLLQRSTAAGVLVEAGPRRLALVGRADVIDPARPLTLLATPRQWTSRAVGVGLYGLRNAVDLVGFARDTVLLRNGPLRPRRRVFIGMTPAASAAFDGERLSGRWGQWAESAASDPAPTPAGGTGTTAVLGWMSQAGPLALPVRWDAGRQAAAVDPAAVDMLGLRRQGPGCLVVDDYGGAGPWAKQGTAIRGSGQLAEHNDGVWVAIEPERVTNWSGATSQTR